MYIRMYIVHVHVCIVCILYVYISKRKLSMLGKEIIHVTLVNALSSKII